MDMENKKVFFGGENGKAGHGWHHGVYSGVSGNAGQSVVETVK